MAYTLVQPPQLDWTDPVYTQQTVGARQTYDTTVGGLNAERTRQAHLYGYTPTYDANGQVQSVQVDPTDPYSKANLLTQSYKEGQTSNRNQYAGRGQLYAGSLNAAQDRGTKGYNIGSNNLQNAFIDFIAGNQGQMNQAGATYNTTVQGAYGDAYGRYVPPDTSTPEATAAPAPTVAQGFTSDPTAQYNVFPTSDGKGEWHVYPPAPDGTQRKVYVKF